jgi:hypothetical protein
LGTATVGLLMTAVHRQPLRGARHPRSAGVRVVARAIASAAFAVLLAGACGGGGGGSSKSAYVAQVNHLCRQAAADRRALVPPGANATPRQLVDSLKQAVAIDHQLQQRITTLSPPSADASIVRELLSLMEQGDQVALQLADAIQHSDASTMNALYPKFSDLGAQTKQIANRYGLSSCTEKI